MQNDKGDAVAAVPRADVPVLQVCTAATRLFSAALCEEKVIPADKKRRRRDPDNLYLLPAALSPINVSPFVCPPTSFFPGQPSFVKIPEDQTGISGGVASFVCQASGEPRPRITWMKKGKKVSSQRFEVRLLNVCRGGGADPPSLFLLRPPMFLSPHSSQMFPSPPNSF